MPFVVTIPEQLSIAATNLANIGSTISTANTAAAAPTTTLLAAGADEVSTAIAALFGSHGQAFQALSAQAENLHGQFVTTLNSSAFSYASAEAANASQNLVNALNMPAEGLLGRPLIGNGADGAPGTGQDGGDGGILWGNGGNGGSGAPGQR
ncbi:PE family protein, partial [Mycobacterium marinum]